MITKSWPPNKMIRKIYFDNNIWSQYLEVCNKGVEAGAAHAGIRGRATWVALSIRDLKFQDFINLQCDKCRQYKMMFGATKYTSNAYILKASNTALYP